MNPFRPVKRAKESIYVRVQDDGSLVCADLMSRAIMRKKKIRRGETVRIAVLKLHDYTQFKKAHALGLLLIDSLDEFAKFGGDDGRKDGHAALKHLQRLSGVECDDSTLTIPGAGALVIRTPRSISYEEMPAEVFENAYAGFCRYLIATWWKDLDQAQIENMASLVGMGG